MEKIDPKISSVTSDIIKFRKLEEQLFLYAAMVDLSDDAIIGFKLDGTIISWNTGAAKIFQYQPPEVLGKNLTIIFPASIKHEFRQLMADIKRGKPIDRYRTERLRKDGTSDHMSIAIFPIREIDNKIIGACSIGRNIDEVILKENRQEFLIKAGEILNSSLDYKKTLEQVSRFIVPKFADWFALDVLEDNKPNRLIIFHKDPNQVKLAWKFHGQFPIDLKSKEGAGKIMRTGKAELYPFIDVKTISRQVDKKTLDLVKKLKIESVMIVPILLRGLVKGAVTLVSTFPRIRYGKIDLEIASDLAKLIGTAIESSRLYFSLENELCERKKYEKKIRSAVKELSDIKYALDQSSIVAITDRNGMIEYANDKFVEISKYSRVELVGKTHRVVNSKYHSKEFMKNLWNTISSGKVWHGEIKNRTKVGTFYWVDTTITPLLGEDGKPERFIAIRNDITERKILEEKKDEFISAASHELKTPITSLKVFSQLLTRRVVKNKHLQYVSYLKRISEQTDKLTQLINELLNVARIQAGRLEYKMEPFSIDDLVRRTTESIQGTSHHQFVVKPEVSTPVFADYDRIVQVLINLLTNAIKYSPKADTIVVETKEKNREANVSVRDFGIGIDKFFHKKIFERFYRVSGVEEETYPGMGMGLYIANEIIKMHKGSVWVESQKDKGSVFTFSIPFAKNRVKVVTEI